MGISVWKNWLAGTGTLRFSELPSTTPVMLGCRYQAAASHPRQDSQNHRNGLNSPKQPYGCLPVFENPFFGGLEAELDAVLVVVPMGKHFWHEDEHIIHLMVSLSSKVKCCCPTWAAVWHQRRLRNQQQENLIKDHPVSINWNAKWDVCQKKWPWHFYQVINLWWQLRIIVIKAQSIPGQQETGTHKNPWHRFFTWSISLP